MNQLSLRLDKDTSNTMGWGKHLLIATPAIISGINLIIIFTQSIVDYDGYLEKARKQLENRGLILEWLDNISGFFWRKVTPDTVAEHEIWWDQAWAVTYFVLAICLYFIIVHWQNVKYLVSGLIIIAFGLIYLLIPVDFFPDFMPVAGSLDDIVILLTSSGTGFSIFGEWGRRRKIWRKVHSCAEQKPLKALETLCEEYGLELDLQSTPSKKDNQ
ncbi:MAG: DUF1232 domain-containing protein [Halothece sp.]